MRFAAIIDAPDTDRARMRSPLADKLQRSGFRIVIDVPGFTLWGERGEARWQRARRMALLGFISKGNRAMPMQSIEALDEHASASAGQSLIERFWGDYVVFLFDADHRRVTTLKSPFCRTPVLWGSREDALILSSDPAGLTLLGGGVPEIDPTGLAEAMRASDLIQARSCLAGVSELRGGSRLSAQEGKHAVDHVWSPWRFTDRDHAIEDLGQAATELRGAIEASIACHAAGLDRSLLKLSGGLDSSILAAALANCGHRFEAVTLVAHDAPSDERRYAAMVAGHLGIRLITAMREPAAADTMRAAHPNSARPNTRSFAQASDAALARVGGGSGAQAIFEGGGGDNVFCAMQSSVAVLDGLASGSIPRAWRAAHDLNAITGASLSSILTMAARRARRGRQFRWPVDLQFMSPEALDLSENALDHPWLPAPPGTPPGRIAHVALLSAAQSWVESHSPDSACPTISPLLSQPIVETCLRIPTWLWIAGGRNRAVAREAFADALPPAILRRTTKGSPEAFVADLYARDRLRLRPFLLDGELARLRLLDRPLLEAALQDPRLSWSRSFMRILRLADIEAWCRARRAAMLA